MKKKLIIVLSIFAAIIVLLLVLVLLALGNTLKHSYSLADAEADNLVASEIVDMISDAVVDDEGNIPEIAKIVIPAENVNALLRIAAYRLNREMKDDGIECAIGWENSAVKAAASILLPVVRGVNVRGTTSPVIADGKLNAPIKGLKAGSLPIPGWVVKDTITADDIRNENLKLAFEAIHDLSATPDGSLKIGIYPAKISNLTRILMTEEEE